VAHLLVLLRSQQLQALPFAQPRPGVWAARTVGYFLQAQVESGSLCPTTMTLASIPVLRKEPALFCDLEPRLYATEHDARDLPWRDKTAVMIGMGMTEKQGGSDVRANTTVALPVRGDGRGAEYALTGHKWFFSAPMCDAHLVVARMGAADGPLSCFFVPRFRDDGSKNPILIQRLKDKLGNRSNSSSEVEFRGTTGILIGEEGRGIPTIIEMATNTRLDCVIGSAALLRAGLVQALHHARHRMAFGRLLADQPLMRNVLADLALESEAATLMMMALAHAFEHADDDPLAATWKRVMTRRPNSGSASARWRPPARRWRSGAATATWRTARWRGCIAKRRSTRSGKARATSCAWMSCARSSVTPAMARASCRIWRGCRMVTPPCARSWRRCRRCCEPAEQLETSARRFAQGLVLTAQAALMIAHGNAESAALFVASRLGRQHGRVFGTLDADANMLARIAARAWPA
jgi:putative acyl-CoA dehydrogenase